MHHACVRAGLQNLQIVDRGRDEPVTVRVEEEAALRVPAAITASATSYSGTPSPMAAFAPSIIAIATWPAWRIMTIRR